jgi:hypothetical protein
MPYQRRTWEDVEAALNDRWDEVPFWTPEEARLAFNEGLQTFNLLTGRWRTAITLVTVGGVADYVLPSSLLYRTRVQVDGRALSPASRVELNLSRPYWRTETTASGGDVPTRITLWAPIDLWTIRLWPTPALGGSVITVDGVSATPQLRYDGQYVDLGEEAFAALLDYALHVCAFAKGGPFFQATLPHFQRFLAYCGEENGQILTSTTYRRFCGLERRDLQPHRRQTAERPA